MAENNSVQYSSFTWKGTEEIMLEDFMEYLKNHGLEFNGGVDDFLKFTPPGIMLSNEKYIWMKGNKAIQKQWEDENDGKPDRIFPGTTFFLPNQKLTTEAQKKSGSDVFLEQKDFTIFWSDYQREILEDESYVPFDQLAVVNGKGIHDEGRRLSGTVVKRKNLNCQVWIYSRALDTLVDISPWVLNVSTNKGMDVGSFSVQLIPTFVDIQDEKLNSYGERVEFFNLDDKEHYLNQDWFTKYIQYNDVVFIRYEVLQRETGTIREIKSSKGDTPFKKSPYDLATGKMWDMIGLVDTNSFTVNLGTTDYVVNIQGRDLMKLFVEDGAFFIPLTMVEGSSDRWFWGGDKEKGAYRRNFVSGAYQYLELYEFQKIKDYSGFIMNQLVNIGIVPDSLFEPSAKRTELYPVPSKEEQIGEVTGIWKIVQAFVDDQLSDRRIVDSSLANPEGTLMDLFNKICQQPFVEFWGDTWGDEFVIMMRQPPFTKSAIQNIYDEHSYIRIENCDTHQVSLQYDDRVYGWYRIMPQNSFLGKSEFSSLAFVPIVMLDEYVDRFGNKRCITNDIYLSCGAFNGKGEEGNVSLLSQALINDLLFTVETTMYLPFTRKGTITIDGDRRIKPGTFVHFAPTNELFYVASVSNSIQFSNNTVDRVTTLTVERGMRMDCIRAKSGEYSYFDLVDIEGLRGAMYKGIANQDSSVPNKATVNSGAFNFFLERGFNK